MIASVLQRAEIQTAKRAVILVAWVTAARVGDTLKLRKMDVSLTGRKMMVTWARGKTVEKRGAYTVHTMVPPEFLPLLRNVIDGTTNDSGLLFPTVTGPQIKIALRTADPALEQRSIRRGALQMLAGLGMPMSTLLLFSGHTSERMLLKYLGHGKLAKVQENTMVEVAEMGFVMPAAQ